MIDYYFMVNIIIYFKHVICIAEDIIIHGKDEQSHNINLNNILKRCLEQGIKLNKSKMEHRVEKVTFMGHVITKDGLKIDQQKIEAIKNYETPKDVNIPSSKKTPWNVQLLILVYPKLF